ncbi:hypothetical protein ACIRJL_10215 [Streptomyces sp. NPDC102383]|uniref:hypothetical protein n=1 Tax=unclassified Streptomyces TaxID=2593676 RepID=UPI00380A149E
MAEVAHIRSKAPNGPRYDSSRTDDPLLDTFENLLLLCPKHHKIVDEHDSLYSVEELEDWKAGQIAQAGHVLHSGDLPAIIASLRWAAQAQEQRAARRATWAAFTEAALPFCEHAQGTASRDSGHLAQQLVTARQTFNATMAAVLREGPQTMVEQAAAVRNACDALILHANVYGPGWMAWRALDDIRTRTADGDLRRQSAEWAHIRVCALTQAAANHAEVVPRELYEEAEAALNAVEGMSPAHTRDLLEDASRREPRRKAVDDLTVAREGFFEALEAFERAGMSQLTAS